MIPPLSSPAAAPSSFARPKSSSLACPDLMMKIDAGKTQGVEKRDRFHSVCKKVPKVRKKRKKPLLSFCRIVVLR
jgi:hypothetical protein